MSNKKKLSPGEMYINKLKVDLQNYQSICGKMIIQLLPETGLLMPEILHENQEFQTNQDFREIAYQDLKSFISKIYLYLEKKDCWGDIQKEEIEEHFVSLIVGLYRTLELLEKLKTVGTENQRLQDDQKQS